MSDQDPQPQPAHYSAQELARRMDRNARNIDDLAAITSKGLESIERQLEVMNRHIAGLSNRMDGLAEHKVSLHQFRELESRVENLEGSQ